MKEKIIKIVFNIVSIVVVYKIWKSVTENATIWEKSSEINFGKFDNIQDLKTPILNVIDLNENISKKIEELRSTLFFRIFKVNLNEECTYFKQSKICKYETCKVCQCEESEVPLPWQQEDKPEEKLEKLKDEKFKKWIDKYTLSETTWIPDSEIDSIEGVYVDLLRNPESFTGYQGAHIWNAIFRENCFADRLDQICSEEKMFYRIFSGVLSNTNIQISSNYFANADNPSHFNLTMFTERFINFKDRVENFFLLYSLMLKAFQNAEFSIRNFEVNTGNQTDDSMIKKLINDIYDSNEMKQFALLREDKNEDLNKFLKFDRIDQLVAKFRNISSIMDCVGCEKCKLHGKLQIYGVATMLKILFYKNMESIDPNYNLKLSRNELIAFVNFFGKVATSMRYIKTINEGIKHGHFIYNVKQYAPLIILTGLLVFVNFIFRPKKILVRYTKVE